MSGISTASVISTVMLILSISFTVILLIAGIVGFFRRWKRSTVALCRIILAVILATIIVLVIGVSTNINQTISEYVSLEVQSEAEEISETAIGLLSLLLYSIIMPIVFVILFVIIDQILRIPAYFISKALHITKQDENENEGVADNTHITTNTEIDPNDDTYLLEKKSENNGKKLLEQFGGAAISMLAALIVISVCILPVTGLFCTIADGISEFSAEAAETNKDLQIENQTGEDIVVDGEVILYKDGTFDFEALNNVMRISIAPIRNNFFVAASYSAPMKLIYKNITRIKIQDISVSFCEEAESLFKLASDAMCFITDFENYGEKQINASDKVANYVINSEFHCEIAAEIISYIAKTVNESTNNEFFDSVIDALKNTTKESVVEDVSTVRDIFKSAIRNNIPKSLSKVSYEENDYTVVLENINSDFIYDVLFAIRNNNHFGNLLTPALNYAFKMVSESLGAEQSNVQAGVDLKSLSDEQLQSEAQNLANALSNINLVIVSFNNLNNSGSNNMDAILDADLAPLGAFIDCCEDSFLLGNGTRELLISLLRSQSFADNGLDEIFNVIADRIERGENLSMERTLVATKELIKVINDYQNNNGSTAELSASMKKIVENLDPETAAVINEMIPKINSSMIDGGNNISEKITQKIITSFVETLSSEEAKEIVANDEELEKEVQAIDMVLDMIKSATSGVVYSTEDVKEVVETIAESKIATNALVSAAYDEVGNLTEDIQLLTNSATEEDKQAVVDACKEYFDEEKVLLSASDIETIKSNLTAIASIFGEDISSQVANWN